MLRLIVPQLLLRRWTTASFWMALEKINESHALQAALRAGMLKRVASTRVFSDDEQDAIIGAGSGTGAVDEDQVYAIAKTAAEDYAKNELSIDDISDVGSTMHPEDGDVLTWDDNAKSWKSKPGGGYTEPSNGIINRTGDLITSVELTNGQNKTYTFYRDGNGLLSSVADGSHTWTFARDSDGCIISWQVE